MQDGAALSERQEVLPERHHRDLRQLLQRERMRRLGFVHRRHLRRRNLHAYAEHRKLRHQSDLRSGPGLHPDRRMHDGLPMSVAALPDSEVQRWQVRVPGLFERHALLHGCRLPRLLSELRLQRRHRLHGRHLPERDVCLHAQQQQLLRARRRLPLPAAARLHSMRRRKRVPDVRHLCHGHLRQQSLLVLRRPVCRRTALLRRKVSVLLLRLRLQFGDLAQLQHHSAAAARLRDLRERILPAEPVYVLNACESSAGILHPSSHASCAEGHGRRSPREARRPQTRASVNISRLRGALAREL